METKIFYKKYRRYSKTDYNKRLSLLKSGKSRLVVRISSKNILAQIVDYVPSGDKVICAVSTKNLEKEFKWKGPKCNISVGYLVGLLLASKAKTEELILDIGKRKSIAQTKVYGVVKGVIDGGVNVHVSEEVLPSEDRITGKHIADYAAMLKKSDKEKYDKIYSSYIKNGLNPEDFTKYFSEIKAKIMGAAK
jgi:large subunit ribosomal protein L18